MKTQFKILVATDYSEPALNAERYAIMLAKETHSALIFFHTFEASLSYPHEFIDLERVDDSPVEFELRKLEQHVEDLLFAMGFTNKDVEYHCMAKRGKLTKEIFTEATIYNADFIILGTHEYESKSMQEMFVTSHTWEIIKNAPIPVLSIPPKASFSGISHMVFATEYRGGEIPVIKFLIALSEQLNSKLTVLHVTNDIFSPDFEKVLFNNFWDEAKTRMQYDKLHFQITHSNNLVDALNGFCIRANSKWLVMSHEKAPLFAKWLNPLSVTKRMTLHTQIPLFAVPDKYSAGPPLPKKHVKKSGDIWNDFFVSAGYTKN
ncbi:MAG TPA: universal stress protein [Bacteroidia bacterium]|jgi:nucleotide-binding universal stress UspA family protein|nr:universal stress protein [Bacteroidia bacterium]